MAQSKKRFSGVKNKNHEQERGENEENNLKKNERSEKGDHIFSSKNERRSKQFFFFKERHIQEEKCTKTL